MNGENRKQPLAHTGKPGCPACAAQTDLGKAIIALVNAAPLDDADCVSVLSRCIGIGVSFTKPGHAVRCAKDVCTMVLSDIGNSLMLVGRTDEAMQIARQVNAEMMKRGEMTPGVPGAAEHDDTLSDHELAQIRAALSREMSPTKH